nr:MAG TPA: Protein of unknown function (DUF2634) [Bacteriophage sp.]
MAFLNQTLWKNAYLLEFRQGNIVEEAFTFSVPPQSEEFVYPQRVRETKTFGGSVIEDYGNDTITISLSGTTINQQVKIIYRSTFPMKYLTGEEEIFYLKDILERYGKFDKLEKKEVYLFCLEKNTALTSKSSKKAWRIFPQDLSIKRSKDRPLSYDYTFKALGIPVEKTTVNINKVAGAIQSVTKTVNGWVEALKTTLEEFKETVENFWSDNILSIISSAKDLADSINTLCETAASYITESIDLADSLIIETYKETAALENEIARTVTLPYSVGIQVNNSCKELINSIGEIKTWFNEITDEKSNKWKQAQSYYKVSSQDLYDAYKGLIGDIEDNANGLVVQARKDISEHTEFPLVVPGADGDSDSVIVAYGYKPYTYKDGDTWATIAYQFYNDSSYATMLQLYNRDISIETITPGDTVYIPVIDGGAQDNSENEVYNEYGSMDSCGTDISIEGEDFTVRNGDLYTTNGLETINQAITNRLNTAVNSRVRNVVYGIRNEAGLPSNGVDAAATYISASVEQTILADPRIESVGQVTWSGKGESLAIEAIYVTTAGEKLSYSGVI